MGDGVVSKSFVSIDPYSDNLINTGGILRRYRHLVLISMIRSNNVKTVDIDNLTSADLLIVDLMALDITVNTEVAVDTECPGRPSVFLVSFTCCIPCTC